ncbi:hypothetical protein GCM10011375_21700 [Hymenobacter qilianensis]|uniref:Uncharacterized protein n=2 Tax=Hymenobacter qilianensis TaxID=1385715 RepID=A0ACB5PS51_9BACT|nr:heparan-alpha-glucosaminide N-acetyltransferase domain-containing protein [Hymenobacter qilianensis]QNP52309.1 DUF1624 domain-containing protein [Hymenobacter qilianensis]GGF66331.1 hypothetical protein GCM10011375_21700 [Hymenobacter qilianensis]
MQQVSTEFSVPVATRATTERVQAVDIVRGLVMVIMALDHVRDFWSPTIFRPEDLGQTSVLLFFTRWITHFCAPTFVFLSGTSIYLYQQKRPNKRQVSWFLLTRGLWLVALELLVISLMLFWGYSMILLQVIWVIGWAMVLLAGLIWLPRWLLALLAFIIIAGHNALPNIQPVTADNVFLALLHNGPFLFDPASLPPFLVAYSIGPWLGVMLAGYLIGPWFKLPLPQRTRVLRLAGIALLAVFVALRATNWYGDPLPWSTQARGLAYSVLSFVNVTKYPSSLLFLCLTLGVALLLLSGVETATNRLSQWLRTFGQVPFFYYILHLFLISFGALVWTTVAFGKPINLSFTPPAQWPTDYHPSLLRAYVVWAVVVLLLYLPCRWYQGFKQRHSYWWLSYV